MKKRLLSLFLAVVCGCSLTACGTDSDEKNNMAGSGALGSGAGNGEYTGEPDVAQFLFAEGLTGLAENLPDDLYRTFYEVFVYSFYDSDGDGIGDLKGLTEKLDYINDGDAESDRDLGANGIWLMPIMPSATYHKYDVIDYCDIDPQYGTMADFDAFMAACEARDIHVLIDLVINHTSSKHPWFLAAVEYLQGLPEGQEPDVSECKYFGYYHFESAKAGGSWYNVPGTDWYYEAPFWGEMPDLNLANEDVRAEIAEITRFWLDKGVAGFRLDAAKEYVSGSTNQNVEILSWLNETVKSQKEDAYLVAEVWENAENYTKYYESGIDSCFDFDFASQDGYIAKTLNGKYTAVQYANATENIQRAIDEVSPSGIDAPFYTNHDMGRSAGYYAGENSASMVKMAQAMNLFMSGSAFLYYGEEIGMKGAGKDENKRLGMLWYNDADAEGMCDGPEYAENVKMKYGSLEDQLTDPGSIYHFVKNVIHVRNAFPEIARGRVTSLRDVSDEQICVIRKEYEGSELYIIFNLSAETHSIDLSGLTVNGKAIEGYEVALYAGSDEMTCSFTGSELQMPAYSVIICK